MLNSVRPCSRRINHSDPSVVFTRVFSRAGRRKTVLVSKKAKLEVTEWFSRGKQTQFAANGIQCICYFKPGFLSFSFVSVDLVD
jgi:hypothetical protein